MAERAPRRRPALAALALALAGVGGGPPEGAPRGRVTAVLDGDTVIVALPGGDERVRLLGIDSPELHESNKLDREVARSGQSRSEIQALGAAAQRALAAEVEGRAVRLERDVEARDRYRRLLAWVWRDDGTLVNEAMVRTGWARLYTFPPNVRHVERLRAAQAAAREAGRGLWASAAGESAATETGAGTGVEARAGEPRGGRGAHPGGRDCPPTQPIKGNLPPRPGAGCIYHLPGFEHYAATRPERCFATEAEARAAGCRRARR